jgi:NAD+ synthase
MSYLTHTENELDYKLCSNLIQRICEGIKEAVDVAVVGMSGGADSTLVTTLCVHALGKGNVVGLHMPYSSRDFSFFNSRSKQLASHLGIKDYTLSIQDPCSFAEKTICFSTGQEVVLQQLAQGNMRSRMRMVYLYAVCGQLGENNPGKRHRVMGTGNLSEDYIGYDTKGGDALADIFPIGELYKQEVYDLLDYLAANGVILDSHIDRVPSAGLWDNQTDESELGMSYNDMAPAIEWIRDLRKYAALTDEEMPLHIKRIMDDDLHDKVLFVWNRHLANKHKHMAPPVIKVR